MFKLVERLQSAVDAVLGLSVIIAVLLVCVDPACNEIILCYICVSVRRGDKMYSRSISVQFIASGLGYYGAFLIGKYQQYDIL